ncbi:uncharacterized protein LOC127738001 [Mytilus californianus]|uniref:uncharacterized protein LOC127738001 n=1 Tax=Mytilus californianus TaxID=6549 RepID=UPI002245DACF|nr:uncharacterized protein LOC127738001 [Mytilus californianus]XP_052104960.1 uncharacterized protein LOC127738001 [Mytilus californianus]
MDNHTCMTDFVIPVYNYLDRCIDELYQNTSSNSQPVLKFRRKFKTKHIKSSNCSNVCNSVNSGNTNKVSEFNGKKCFSTENRNFEYAENGSLLSQDVLVDKKHISNENINFKNSESGKLLSQAVWMDSKQFDQHKDLHKQNIQKNFNNSYLQQFALKRKCRIGIVETEKLKGDHSYSELSSKPRIEHENHFSRSEQESFSVAVTEDIIDDGNDKNQSMNNENHLKSYFAPHGLNQAANTQQKDPARLKENDLINLSFDMLLENASKPTKLPKFKFRLKSKSRSLPICKVDQDLKNTVGQTWLEPKSLPICKVDPAFKNTTEPTRLESKSLPIWNVGEAEESTTDLTPSSSKCLPLWKVCQAVESTAEPIMSKSRSLPLCKVDRTVESNTQQSIKNYEIIDVPGLCEKEDSDTGSDKSGITSARQRRKDDNSPDIPRRKLDSRNNSKHKNHKDMHRIYQVSRKEDCDLNRRWRNLSKQHAMKTDQLHSSRHNIRHDKEYRENHSHRNKNHKEKPKHRKYDVKTSEKSLPSEFTTRIDKYFQSCESVRKTSEKVVSLENKTDCNKIDKPFLTRPYSKSSKKEKASHKESRNSNTKYSSKSGKVKIDLRNNNNLSKSNDKLHDEKSKKKGSFEKSHLCTDHKEKKSYDKNYRTDKQRKTRGAAKIVLEQQKRTKELTTIYQNMQDKILQKHLEDISTTNNVYDCLHVMDEKVDLISSEDDVLPKSQATEWSNGEKQYSLTNNNQSKHGFHYGGIWKSITREKV